MNKPTRGRKNATRSHHPDPLLIGHMIHELIEMAPRVIYGHKEVTTGAREPHDRPNSAVIDLLDRDTGISYRVIVIPSTSSNA